MKKSFLFTLGIAFTLAASGFFACEQLSTNQERNLVAEKNQLQEHYLEKIDLLKNKVDMVSPEKAEEIKVRIDKLSHKINRAGSIPAKDWERFKQTVVNESNALQKALEPSQSS